MRRPCATRHHHRVARRGSPTRGVGLRVRVGRGGEGFVRGQGIRVCASETEKSWISRGCAMRHAPAFFFNDTGSSTRGVSLRGLRGGLPLNPREFPCLGNEHFKWMEMSGTHSFMRVAGGLYSPGIS
jgi:hypothetical protein